MSLPCEPLFFTPCFIETIWGGNLLQTLFNKNAPANVPIGESWEISGLTDAPTLVRSGPLTGQSIATIYSNYPEDLVGRSHASTEEFPLLIKFIDAKTMLSVQVHPTDEQARTLFHQSFGKTECWYIAHAGADARICTGFKKTMTADDLRLAITSGTIESNLDIFKVTTGEVYFIPAGKVHAIMGDVVIYEIQQSSNTTLRLYDWKRTDSAGASRNLHVEDALAVASLKSENNNPVPSLVMDDTPAHRRTLRVACPYFALEEYHWVQSATVPLIPYTSCRVITLLNGKGTLLWEGGKAALKKGDTALLPASLTRCAFDATEGTLCLSTSIPDVKRSH